MQSGHAKGRPAQVAFSLTGRGCCPLWVVACAAGRSSVRAVTRTAGVRLSKYRASRLYFDCNRGKFVFLETNGHIPMTIGHSLLKAGSEIEQVDRSIL